MVGGSLAGKGCAQELAAWFEHALYSITSSIRWPAATLSDSDSVAGLEARAPREDLERVRPGLSPQAGFQSPAEGTRSARLKRELAFSHAISIVSSAICSSS
jgi:hypothetical protein